MQTPTERRSGVSGIGEEWIEPKPCLRRVASAAAVALLLSGVLCLGGTRARAEGEPEICNNGVDDDFDEATDFPDDSDCIESKTVTIDGNNQAKASFGPSGDTRTYTFTFPPGHDGEDVTITESRMGQGDGQQYPDQPPPPEPDLLFIASNGEEQFPCVEMTMDHECVEVELDAGTITGGTLTSKLGWQQGLLAANPRLIHFTEEGAQGEDITTSYNEFGDDPVLTGGSDCCTIFKGFDVPVLVENLDPIYDLPFFDQGTYKLGRVIPIKLHETDPVTLAALNDDTILISIAKIPVPSSSGPITPIDVSAVGAATGGNTMVNAGNGNYHYNWSTKGLTAGTYSVTFLSDNFGAQSATIFLQ